MEKLSPIMQMYYGHRGNYEKIPCTKEYFKLLEKVIENDDELCEKLSAYPELLELYKKTNESIEALHCESADSHFSEGFKFGVLMGLDIAGDIDTDEE